MTELYNYINACKLLNYSTKKINKKIIEDYAVKICSKCNEVKQLTEYSKNNEKGIKATCKQCIAIKNKNYYHTTNNNVYECECGAVVKYSNRYEHKKTIKHMAFVN